MKDKELIEQLEALSEVIEWLEKRDETDLEEAKKSEQVDEEEIDKWLKSTNLKKIFE
jgi:hypothetical protein